MRNLQHIKEPYRTVLTKLVESLLKKFGDDLISVVLYGSVARGEARPDSDIDLIIVIKNLPKSKFKRQDLFIEIENELEPLINELQERGYYIDFSPILKTLEEAQKITPLYLDLIYDAVILFDRDNFFQTILSRLKAKLQELGAERIRFGKKWYWVLKKDYKFGEVIKIE